MEHDFFLNSQRKITCKSVGITHVVYLDYEDFTQILLQFPKEYEKYCNLRDTIFQRLVPQKAFCSFCEESTHYELECPVIFPQQNRFLTIQKYDYSVAHEQRVSNF